MPAPLQPVRGFYLRAAIASVLLAAGAFAVIACDTPVYRFAMYQWEPEPYQLLLFHEGSPPEQAGEILEEIQQAASVGNARGNLVAAAHNLAEDPELNSLPVHLRRAFRQQESETVPQWLLYSPSGEPVYFGSLTREEIPRLLDSPARRRIAELLEEGSLGVLVLLEAPSAAAADPSADDDSLQQDDRDAKAESAVRELIRAVEAGEVELHEPSEAEFEGSAGNADAVPGRRVGFLRVSRQDPAEQWLVRQLLKVEPDLHEFEEPMVFGLYGRGRALPPYIGRGISPENLRECIQFIAGACSCTVKEENPGVDLLMTYDWAAAAEAMAERHGAEEGNSRYEGFDLFRQLAAAPIDSQSPDRDAPPAATHSEADVPTSLESTPAGEATAAQASAQTLGPAGQVAASSESPHVGSAETRTEAAAPSAILLVGGGVAIALLLALTATFFLWRPS